MVKKLFTSKLKHSPMIKNTIYLNLNIDWAANYQNWSKNDNIKVRVMISLWLH